MVENFSVPQKTYWHLLNQQRVPTDYEVASTNLLYYLKNGLETDVPIKSWMQEYQQGSPLRCSNWERFNDPRETTYFTYTLLQSQKEACVDWLLEQMEDNAQLFTPAWLERLELCLPPLLYPLHALQMLSAYIGHLAPCGKLTIAAAFQAADEIRRIQRFAYRIAQLRRFKPDFGYDRRPVWQTHAMWQPLRRLLERLLITYDWGESFVVLNLVLKPDLDELLMVRFGETAEQNGDPLLNLMLSVLNEDCIWHRSWCHAAAETAKREEPCNTEVIENWRVKWQAACTEAIAALAPTFKGADE